MIKNSRIIPLLVVTLFSLTSFSFRKNLINSNLSNLSKKAYPTVYQSDDLKIIQLSNHVFEHISYLNTAGFGKVPCNGMIVTDDHEALIFDTTTDDTSSAELINWVNKNLKANIQAVISTHFHEDCLGGLKVFKENHIPSYALSATIELAKENHVEVPENGFEDVLLLPVGTKKIYATFYGEGHTRDNIVGYFPDENILFGGCLIKELNAGKGNLADANVQAWAETVKKVKAAYPDVKLVIPGHGTIGSTDLLDYTIRLFNSN